MELPGLLTKKDEALPLKDVSVDAFIQGSLVGLESKLKYSNEGNDPVEVLFRTPVEDSFAIVGLTAMIEGRRIRADLKEKEKAREMYEEALTSGRTAALGEEKKGDIFSLVLGNLPPGGQAEIHLTMVGELAIDAEGSVRFCLPTVLKPRYSPASSENPLSPVPGGGAQVRRAQAPALHRLAVHVAGADAVHEITSPSHRLATSTEGNTLRVELAKEEQASSQDVVILIRPTHPHRPSVQVELGQPAAGNSFMSCPAVMLSFFPEFKNAGGQVACEFVFVVDRSGSMSGSYIRQAGETLVLFLKSIPEGCYFNVIGFGSRFEKLFQESLPYNQANMEEAVRHAQSLKADLGGTELKPPLEYVFSQPLRPHLTRQVFVLTDGSVSNTDAVIQLVRKNSDKSRCFSFGIGSGASTHLVKGIADAGQGTAEFITSGERMQPKVIRSLKHAMQPAVTNTKVVFNLPFGYSAKLAPKKIRPIFIGDRTVVYALLDRVLEEINILDSQASVTLSCELLGSKIEHKMEFQLPNQGRGAAKGGVSTVHHLAGKSLIRECENNDSPKDEIVKLSCDMSVVCKHTAFIAVDEEQKEPVKGSLQIWDVQAKADLIEDCLSFDCFTSSMQYTSQACSAPRLANTDNLGFGDLNYMSADTDLLGMDSEELYEECEHEEGELYVPMATAKLLSTLESLNRNSGYKSLTPAPLAPVQVQAPASKGASLSQVINLQLASGAWELTAPLAVLLGGSVEQLKASCPVPCEGSLQTLWATALVLAFLKNKMADSQEEWELVAAKAENWLKKQNSPVITIAELSLKASKNF